MARHEDTLEAVFSDPAPSSIEWRRIEAMLIYLGAELSEGAGSRVRVRLKGVRAVFHRPHPQKEAHKPLVRSVRKFLRNAGVGVNEQENAAGAKRRARGV